MSISVQPRRLGITAPLLLSLALAACSGSTASAPAGGGSGTVAPGAASVAPAGASVEPVVASAGPAAAGGGVDAPYCAAIKVADAQALAKPTLSAAQTGGPESCTFVLPGQDLNGDNITVTVLQGDADKHFYNDSVNGPVSTTPNPLPGVGDVAVWEQFTGESAPEVIAHQGSLTCVAQPPADTSQLTIDQTGSGPMYQISASAAAVYAAKMAVLCTDVFSVGG